MSKHFKLTTFFLSAFLLGCCSVVFAQRPITGKVLDEKSNPLVGATIKIAGKSTAVVTGADGSFTITGTKGENLEISYIGKATEKIAVGDKAVINITLKESADAGLNEVVVTGYMTQKRADLTGAVSVVGPKELSKSHGTTNVLQALQGVVPGLHITTDGNPSGNVGIQVRGLTSLNGGSPLIVIDGVPSYVNLRDVNPENIASIQVLKDAYSASIYGTQGGAGVILIQTKKGQPGKTRISYHGSVGVA